MKKALITGITGQDGSYLTELLLEKDYEVHGIVRRSSVQKLDRIEHLLELDEKKPYRRLFLHYGDLTDSSSIFNIIKAVQPDEIYNLAAQSHVRVSFEIPEITANCDALGTLRILESVKALDLQNKTKIYQASTSELYGKVIEVPQTENTPFYPRSPYGVAKLYSFWMIKNYREAYNMYAVNGILFNHESERRGETFVTRKITLIASKIALGLEDTLYLGNLYAKRDWGHAKDYVEAMWLMLQQDKPEDFVIATGEEHSVKEFVIEVFKHLGIEIEWKGEGLNEIGINKSNGKIIVKIDPYFFRPTEVDILKGDNTKAKTQLGWSPRISFQQLVKNMTVHDYNLIKKKYADRLKSNEL